jgi:hypothetical protein
MAAAMIRLSRMRISPLQAGVCKVPPVVFLAFDQDTPASPRCGSGDAAHRQERRAGAALRAFAHPTSLPNG